MDIFRGTVLTSDVVRNKFVTYVEVLDTLQLFAHRNVLFSVAFMESPIALEENVVLLFYLVIVIIYAHKTSFVTSVEELAISQGTVVLETFIGRIIPQIIFIAVTATRKVILQGTVLNPRFVSAVVRQVI